MPVWRMSDPCSAVMMSSVCLVSRPPRWIGTHDTNASRATSTRLVEMSYTSAGPQSWKWATSARAPGRANSRKPPACSAWPSNGVPRSYSRMDTWACSPTTTSVCAYWAVPGSSIR